MRADPERTNTWDIKKNSPGCLSVGLSLWIAIFFLVFASAFGVFAFLNFPAHIVLLTILLPSALPIFLLVRGRLSIGQGFSKRSTVPSALWGVGGGLYLLVFLMSGLSSQASSRRNFGKLAFEQEGKFHPDKAFHVAIIRSIQESGYPSTGQHENEFIWYHVLTHYVGAGWTALVGLDPWDSYALLFYAKATALLLTLLVFVSKISSKKNPLVFLALFSVGVPALTNSWHAVLSHGQWVPFMLLFLFTPWVVKTISSDRIGLGALIAITVLVFALSLGKISIGFGFASVVGLWLFLKKPKDLRVYFVGSIWLIWFAVWNWQTSISTPPEQPLVQRVGLSWPDVFSLMGVTVLVLVLWLLTKKKDWGVFLSVLVTVGTIYVFLPLFVARTESDTFYFLHGLYSVVVLILFSMLANSFPASRDFYLSERPRVKLLVPYVAFFGVLLIPLLPTIAKSPVVAGFDPAQGFKNIYSANTSTYEWPSADRGNEGSWSVLGGTPVHAVTQLENLTFLSRLQDAVDQKLSTERIEKNSALLFISKEGWEEIEAIYDVRRPWATGLLVKAVTGVTLLHSVPEEHPEGYGFADYSLEALRLSPGEETLLRLCEFEKPVLLIDKPATKMDISVVCK